MVYDEAFSLSHTIYRGEMGHGMIYIMYMLLHLTPRAVRRSTAVLQPSPLGRL